MARHWSRSIVAVLFLLPTVAHAAVPGTLSFAARIADGGRPVVGNHDFTFSFFDAETAGTALWTEQQTLAVADGVVTAVLGADAGNPIPAGIFNGAPLFLEVALDTVAFTPRMAFHGVPYAIRAGLAETALSATSAATASDVACSGCIEDAEIVGISGSKVAGAVASATNATNAASASNLACSGCVQDAEIQSVSFTKVTGVPAFACSRPTNGCTLAATAGSTVVSCIATCPAGTTVTGGGCDGFLTTNINVSRPTGNGWDCWWTRSATIGNSNVLNSYAVCCN